MVWDESYALGVAEIDKQHKGLFTAVNRVVSVVEAEDAARNRRVCAEAVKYLHNYTISHNRYRSARPRESRCRTWCCT